MKGLELSVQGSGFKVAGLGFRNYGDCMGYAGYTGIVLRLFGG